MNEILCSPFTQVTESLETLVPHAIWGNVAAARRTFAGDSSDGLESLAAVQVDFFPAVMQERLRALLPQIGQRLIEPVSNTINGASSSAFHDASKLGQAPLSAYGYYRLGEDGRLCFLTKSEHYHASLGHAFPGYKLLDYARQLGIPNCTHNNTRGFITRYLEEYLTRLMSAGKSYGVLNLETGSLACEAALKMILIRSYQMDPGPNTKPAPERTPIILTVGDWDGGLTANYHGTTILTQMMRGWWPLLRERLESGNWLKIHSVRPNSIEDLDAAFAHYNQAPYSIVGFFHEIVMMNYGGILLTPEFLNHAYALCKKAGAATVCDEIQSGVWNKELFLCKEYGLQPDFVVLGKGFPGGEYAASRLLFSKAYDGMAQFGALITNGQEELASLAYLVTAHWAVANAEHTTALGEYFQSQLLTLADRHAKIIKGINGHRHLAAIMFTDLSLAKSICSQLNACGLDISTQAYKSDCPPAALLKLPLITDKLAIDSVVTILDSVLSKSSASL
ncbi:MAG: aminotransferase class III-fold pyridoxal phosphate-dependent enzyme [Verrucomicrobiota bacterium]|nr:aminotransferase class III-fold pyridoxal phosphate-dependent enzyme [Verrucomicrobiota bacterium]